MTLLNYKGKWWIVGLPLIAITLTILLEILVPTVNADVLVFGSVPDYSAIILPNNSYVHQGENISQGNWYDLRGVYGFSGKLAHWNDDSSSGVGQPDQIVTLKGYGLTYVGKSEFPVGRWWQWDGQTTGFGNGNAYVFYVNPGQAAGVHEKTIVQTANIVIKQNGSTIEIPVTYTQVQTYYGTPIPTTSTSTSGTIAVSPTETPVPKTVVPVNHDIQDQNGVPIVGGVPGATVVTKKSPVPIAVPVCAIIAGLIVLRWRE